jgi:ABC-type multidrug transport system fused ATPase/permease subunit
LISAAILAVTLLMASGRKGTSFPVSGLILGALVLIYGFISTRTIIGRHVYAVGGNRHAAELSGVRSKRVNFLVMMNMSILAALAGMMFVARSNASGPFDGVGWELDAIAAVFIGGAAVTGGVGTVIGSIVGGLVMAVLNNGMQLLGVGADLTQIIKGLVLLIAVAFDVYNKMQGKPVDHRAADAQLQEGRGAGIRQGGLTFIHARPSRSSRTSHLELVSPTRERNRMRTPIKSLLAVSAVAALALTGCGRSDSSTTATSGAAGAAARPAPSSVLPSRRRPRRTGCSPSSCSRTG